jgi:TrmH family RNA methyltransferase
VAEHITSLQNVKIKNIVKLQKASERKEQGKFIIEGLREIGIALASGIKLHSFFLCTEMRQDFPSMPAEVVKYTVSKEVFDKMAYRENSDGCLAVAEINNSLLREIKLSDSPFIIVLEGIEKPGNLGAILRTADAAQVDAVIICDPKTDIYNPNVIRSSVGCVFTNQVVACTSEEALEYLTKNGISSYAAALTASDYYQKTDMAKSCAIVMGTEADGLSKFWLEKADKQIKIAMRGKIDSLNVSTSCAVLVFEAMRQRGF